MRRLGSAVFFVIFSLLAAAPAAHAQKRVALVIGNSAYQHTGKLANPRNDATDISAALKKLGFQVVDVPGRSRVDPSRAGSQSS